MNKEEWYRLRDDRTRRIDSVSQGIFDAEIEVILEDDISKCYSCQLMALVALNLLSRWCRKIHVIMPTDVPILLPINGDKSFNCLLNETMTSIDPYGDFTFNKKHNIKAKRLIIGNNASIYINSDDVKICGDGWISGIGTKGQDVGLKGCNKNPIGPSFAACLGVSALFGDAGGIGLKDRKGYYSLFNFTGPVQNCGELENPDIPEDLDFGRLYQVGCGAVGSSLSYLLSQTDYQGEIHLIDYDEIEIENLCSSLAFFAEDAYLSKKKVLISNRLFDESRIKSIPHIGDYDNFLSEGLYLTSPPDTILCLANERNIWDTIQSNCPPLVIHGTTTVNWGINFGRHYPFTEWCLMCRFKDDVIQTATMECAKGTIAVNVKDEKEIIGVLPFLSTASAVLVLTEIIRANAFKIRSSVNQSIFSFSPIGGMKFLSLTRKKISDCPKCSKQYLGIYPNEIKRTKHWTKSDGK